jgi:hypothetical protein
MRTWHAWEEGKELLILVAACCDAVQEHGIPHHARRVALLRSRQARPVVAAGFGKQAARGVIVANEPGQACNQQQVGATHGGSQQQQAPGRQSALPRGSAAIACCKLPSALIVLLDSCERHHAPCQRLWCCFRRSDHQITRSPPLLCSLHHAQSTVALLNACIVLATPPPEQCGHDQLVTTTWLRDDGAGTLGNPTRGGCAATPPTPPTPPATRREVCYRPSSAAMP